MPPRVPRAGNAMMPEFDERADALLKRVGFSSEIRDAIKLRQSAARIAADLAELRATGDRAG